MRRATTARRAWPSLETLACGSSVSKRRAGCPALATTAERRRVASGLPFWTTTICGLPTSSPVKLDAARRAGRDWAYTGSVNFEDGRIVYSQPPLPPDDVIAALPRYNAIPGGGSNVLVRRAVWSAAGPFDTRLPMGEDWEMWIRLARHGPPAWVCSPLMAKRMHPSNLSLSTTRFVRGTELIEQIHDIEVDWGRVHRWLAERHLRSGHRAAAAGRLVRAALRGQAGGVLSDVGAILQRRVRRVLAAGQPDVVPSDPWRAAAVAWLRELEDGIQ